MPINETQLNGRIATLLDRMNARWSAYGETHGAFEGNQRQPDILVHQQGLRPVIVENEYLPAHTVEPEAIARLGENLDTDIVGTSGKINAVVALSSLLDLQNCSNHSPRFVVWLYRHHSLFSMKAAISYRSARSPEA